MALLNFTFQEASPLITYSGVWTEGSPSNDTLFASYNGSFRVTQVAQSSLSFTFFGTAVTLFGASRPNHGNYSVNLDLQPLFVASGFGDNEFNKSLWNADQLAYTQHTVTLTNIPVASGPFFDLDFVSIERQIGQPGDTLQQLTLDDTSPSVNFVGPWESTTGVSSAYQGTLHNTKTANAQVSFSFEGASLELYGQYANAPYTVTLDNQPAVSLRGLDVDLTPSFQHPQTLLYLVDGLSDGNHTVTLTNGVSNENRPFFFDYAIIRGTSNPNVTSSPTTNSPAAGLNSTSTSTSGASNQSAISGNSSSNHKSQVAAIAGGIVGALAVIVILGIGVLLLIRRRRGLARDEPRADFINSEPNPYIIYNDVRSGGGSHEQRQSQDRLPPPVLPVANPPSKFRAALRTYPIDPSTSATSTTSASRSIPSSSQSGSTSRRGQSRSSSSRGRRGGSRGTAVQEEDAGVAIDPDEVATPLPPAYNPTWGHNPP